MGYIEGSPGIATPGFGLGTERLHHHDPNLEDGMGEFHYDNLYLVQVAEGWADDGPLSVSGLVRRMQDEGSFGIRGSVGALTRQIHSGPFTNID